MKHKIKSIMLCLSLLAVAYLTVHVYSGCKKNCLFKKLCIKKTTTSPKAVTAKCKNNCKTKCKAKCKLNDTRQIAVINNKAVTSQSNQIPDYIFTHAILTQQISKTKSEIASTGPPVQLGNDKQSILCVFVI
ncbi:MAG: hypothetical protein A2Y12_04860 [Planctomycetes bacterium GWF2_42_9]|nr:MAG: hypothetical protein A2Y12_04860 [Planctomycetes bacterium GWF2_42_9]